MYLNNAYSHRAPVSKKWRKYSRNRGLRGWGSLPAAGANSFFFYNYIHEIFDAGFVILEVVPELWIFLLNGIPKSQHAVNGVVMLGDKSVELLQDTKQKSKFVEESNKDWEEYWERYDRTVSDSKQTSV